MIENAAELHLLAFEGKNCTEKKKEILISIIVLFSRKKEKIYLAKISLVKKKCT